jgi:hypothetical protein
MARPAQTDPAVVDIHHCPTCGMSYLECGVPYPPSLHDVTPLHCRLPRGHHSAAHWRQSPWPGAPDLLWFTDEDHQPGPDFDLGEQP